MRNIATLFVLGLACCLGCGDGGLPKRVPVEGSVLYKQKPVEGATVVFHGEGAARVASGITDKEGKFQLTMYNPNDGAIVGNHKITVIKMDTSKVIQGEMNAEDPGEAYTRAMTMAAKDPKMGAKDELPSIYGKTETTPLQEAVTEKGPNVFTLQLK